MSWSIINVVTKKYRKYRLLLNFYWLGLDFDWKGYKMSVQVLETFESIAILADNFYIRVQVAHAESKADIPPL